MSDGKILLYYKMTPLSDPEAIMLWQKTLCDSLGLKGRILVSKHGLNGTVGGTLEDCKRYVKQTRKYPAFHDIAFKWSDGDADDFPRMSVKVRDEIVTFTVPDEVKVDENGVVGGGVHLKPAQVNKLVEERGDDVVFFDGRNAMEAQIGKFKNAIVPDVETTRDFIDEIESGKYDDLKDKPVVTYCTGGIRCEILSALMKNRGFNEIYQIDGGIVRYGEKFGNGGLWEGSMYIFDKRMHHEFGEGVEDPHFKQLGHCVHCDASTNRFHNCVNPECRELTLLCDSCAADPMTKSCDKPECKAISKDMVEKPKASMDA